MPIIKENEILITERAIQRAWKAHYYFKKGPIAWGVIWGWVTFSFSGIGSHNVALGGASRQAAKRPRGAPPKK